MSNSSFQKPSSSRGTRPSGSKASGSSINMSRRSYDRTGRNGSKLRVVNLLGLVAVLFSFPTFFRRFLFVTEQPLKLANQTKPFLQCFRRQRNAPNLNVDLDMLGEQRSN